MWYCVSSVGNTDLIWLFGISDPSLPSFIPFFHGIFAEKPSVFYSSNKKAERNQRLRNSVQAFFSDKMNIHKTSQQGHSQVHEVVW